MPERTDILISFDGSDAEVAASLGISLAGSASVCVERAVSAQNAAIALVLESGYLLLKAKAEAQHGEFERLLKSHGMSRQRASDAMLTAKFYTQLPIDQRKQAYTLSKTKLRMLASADPDVVQELMSEPAGRLQGLTVRELLQRLDDMTNVESSRVKQLQAEIEFKQSIIDKQRRSEPVYQFHPATHAVRDECLAYQAEVEVGLNSLWALFEGVADEDVNAPEWRMRIEQVWVTAHVAAARAHAMLLKVIEYAPADDLPGEVGFNQMLTDDEAARWLHDYPLIERKALAAKQDREFKRQQAQPKGRGRPKKQ
ncbi:MAG: hypothetical protein CTY21_09415 [Methylomonas sp.]|nr:MAG: hypothetical protein CTY21_09415 [Methylomonas sp.]